MHAIFEKYKKIFIAIYLSFRFLIIFFIRLIIVYIFWSKRYPPVYYYFHLNKSFMTVLLAIRGRNSSHNGMADCFKIPFRPQVLMLLAQLLVTRIFHELNE